MAITYNGKQHDHFYLNGEKFEKSLRDMIGKTISVKDGTWLSYQIAYDYFNDSFTSYGDQTATIEGITKVKNKIYFITELDIRYWNDGEEEGVKICTVDPDTVKVISGGGKSPSYQPS
ncbi:hypothetical protein PT287_03125 [Lactobacillus sp. ESL0679]|uniref:hypothetical protein n=1 Tax=Lactobacillus sp. ESL0679 TaxID=2983209 RepID=UPI0023FA4138|nr:hypothetical protein [Lactobacillus sp. ESL0679]MDF7682513.1 hypothetical protein [Lactobacillus sp. ESL0679]